MSNDARTAGSCYEESLLTYARAPSRIEEKHVDVGARPTAWLQCNGADGMDVAKPMRARFTARASAVAVLLALLGAARPSHADPPRSGAPGKAEASATTGKAARPKGGSALPAPAPPSSETLKSEPEGPEAEGKARARAIFEQAVSAYKEGKFYDAVELFLETNRIYPDSKLCFNIGRAYEGLGHSAGALRYYREYLRRTPGASDKADVEASIRQLEAALAQRGLQQMSVSSTPDNAVLSIDGHTIALTPWTGETWPGKHRVTTTHPGYVESQQIVELSPHRAIDVQIEMKAEPPPPPIDAKAGDSRTESSRGVTVLTVSTLAAGAVLLGSALAVQLSQSDSGTSSTAAFLGGAGAGATAVGGVLLYFDLSGSRSK
jgi:tetratricopeptide (TPR) repeat protein